ncbi:MAG TPA: GtrA family protein [Candidatus Saccharimonadales bacterium]|nr:GtrA family protein [Candidatus Saccharimonadales bacterium]
MEKAKYISKALYQHSFVRYVVIGGTTFAIDFFLLVALHGFLNINLIIATTVAYWVSIAFNFLANRFWTFGATETHIAKHLASYLTLLGVNYLYTVGFLTIATHFGMHYTVAKVIAVITQISWTYFIYKKYIFK